MTIKAARLDADGVFQAIDELPDEGALTPRHIAAIADCDLPPGKYRWIADPGNKMGGAFWPVSFLAKQAALAQAAAEKKARQAFIDGAMRSGKTRRQATLEWHAQKKGT